ncbi:unnamed protein product [Phyllotreta striolata]|uniref:Uncharacterized protein n=1 Tax=Phyllotreta striolata TaxID=444603 RepID=A0A9N9XPA0_PHYSR|nr:unnamed protein product [Phyllotreta striolata]
MTVEGPLWEQWGPCDAPIVIPDDDVRLRLEPCDYYKKRQELIRKRYIPRLKEVEPLLGPLLARLVYDECDVGLRQFIEQDVLFAPYGDMWSSPSDLLRQKLVLKAPENKLQMKNLNHLGIIEKGASIEQRFLKKLHLDKKTALKRQKQELIEEFQKSIEDEIKAVVERERNACREKVAQFSENFKLLLEEELKDTTKKLRKEFGEQTVQHDALNKREGDMMLESAIENVTKNITQHFLDELSKEEEAVAYNLLNQLRGIEVKRTYYLEKQEAEFDAKLEAIRYNLECRSIVNMFYIIFMERRKCLEEKEALKMYYKDEINDIFKIIGSNQEKVDKIKNDIEHVLKDIKIREICMSEILKRYQSFVKIALKNAPAHAKFLLSIEKLLLFELTETLSRLKPCPEPVRVIEPEEEPGEPATVVQPEVKSDKSVAKPEEDKPYVFDSKLYVKENFRKFNEYLSKSMDKDDLWGKDADLFVVQLKKSVPEMKKKKHQVPEVKATNSMLLHISKMIFNDELSNTPAKTSEPEPNKEVQCADEIVKQALKEEEPNRLSNKLKRPIKYPKIEEGKPSAIDYSKIGTFERAASLLTSANSVELLYQKASMPRSDVPKSDDGAPVKKEPVSKRSTKKHGLAPKRIKKESPPKREPSSSKKELFKHSSAMLPLEARDSMILRQCSMLKQRTRSFSLSPRDSIEVKNESMMSSMLKKQSSKLLTTRDSIAILRESMLALETAGLCSICHEKYWPKIPLLHKDYGCEKCRNPSNELLETRSKSKLGDKNRPSKQLTLSHIEIIETERESPANVVILPVPTLLSSKEDEATKPVFQPSKRIEKKGKTKEDPCSKIAAPTAKIEGDPTTNEYAQDNDEFTKDRIRSFIKLMDNCPNLIRLFTSCQQ